MKGCRKIPIHFFRTFPSGMAGLGLLLLRGITALTLGYLGYCLQEGAGETAASVFSFSRLVGVLFPVLGILMIVGFATMISGILSCALLVISFAWLHSPSNGLLAIAAGLSLVLMLAGPGAYSLDARLFGWRRIEIARRTPKPKP
jgi:putative oxidoreductase